MDKTKKSVYSPILVIAIYAVAHILLLLVSLMFKWLFLDGALSFECSFYSLFRLYCPGCAGTRALSALLEFNLLKATLLYPPLTVAVGFIVYLDVLGVISLFKRSYRPILSFRGRYTIIIPLCIMLFFAVRNVCLFLGFDLVEFASNI